MRNKEASRIADLSRFTSFVDDHVRRVSGFNLIGDGVHFGFFVGETRNARNESTYVGCSVLLRGSRWKSADYETLLKLLCSVEGVDRADACRRAEWEYRHRCTKKLPQFSIERTLGVDMSASLPGLYLWTVYSEELVARHLLGIPELADFASHYERWSTPSGGMLHAFRLYEHPNDWEQASGRITSFLAEHSNFFSMVRIAGAIEASRTKDSFDAVTRPYLAGATPWHP